MIVYSLLIPLDKRTTSISKRNEGSTNFIAPFNYNFNNITIVDVNALIVASLVHKDIIKAYIIDFKSLMSLSKVNRTIKPPLGDF